ncbi:MAG: hypothetical protein IJZ61_08910 [Oscillospiraceae bacterium]|nr:hypothetical protein [Oscillospiraceae bacterium]
MKKQLIPLFVMSVISALFSLASLGVGIWAIAAEKELSDTAVATEDGLLAVLAIFGSLFIILMVVIMLIAFAATALLAIFGIICALKNGRFSLACLVLGSIGTVLSATSLPAIIEEIVNDFNPIVLIPSLYFIGYTVCAAIAFAYKKKAINEQVTEAANI